VSEVVSYAEKLSTGRLKVHPDSTTAEMAHPVSGWAVIRDVLNGKRRMYAEKFFDVVRSFDAWKCVACGEVLDPTIAANRARNNNIHLGYYFSFFLNSQVSTFI
jgi:hypothetical protein